MSSIIIPGGSGFIGQYLAKHFAQQGHTVHILSRQPQGSQGNVYMHTWDGVNPGPWQELFEGATAIINLTGRSVDCRYTAHNKQVILASRLDATRAVAKAIQQCKKAPSIWFNASSATIYADTRGNAPANTEESTQIGNDFSMGVCKQWEACCLEQDTPHTRKVLLRMAIVLGQGSAMVPLRRLVQCGLGGKMGDGQQYFSWIHIDDLAGILDLALANDKISGIVNCASPNPVTNADFMRQMRKAVGMPFGLPSPAWLLGIGAKLIGTETELILKSRKVVSKKMADQQYAFHYPSVDVALRQLLAS